MAALFITPAARVVVCHNSETSQVFDHELPGLGFQLKERAWTEPLPEILSDLCRGRRVGSDRCFPNTQNYSDAIRQLRTPLTPFECSRIRTLGRNVVHAVEATARSLKSGRIEAEIAGEMAHRLIKHQITPRRLQVLADSRGRRYRHWRYDDTQGEPGALYLLEINTQPGMTPLSLVPEIAAHQGITFADLVDWLVKDAGCER